MPGLRGFVLGASGPSPVL